MSDIRRIVVKLGTQVVVDPETGAPATKRLQAIIHDIAAIRDSGLEVILVSSGAVGLGRQTCSINGPVELPVKQACAAIGQSRLMALYSQLCAPYQIIVAQVLVTSRDFVDRASYLNLRSSCQTLLSLRALPIFNENDVVSVAGIREKSTSHESSVSRSFDDNDKLSALVAAKLSADLLVILTNVEGVYTENPNDNPQAALISRIESLQALDEISCSGKSTLGRGGMQSKLEAAKIAGICGVKTVITSAERKQPIQGALHGECGTTVSIHKSDAHAHISGRKRWFGFSSGYAGTVTIDARARNALEKTPCSLLPVGVVKVDGEFGVGDIVSIVDVNGEEVGRGVSSQRAESIRRIAGQKTQNAKALLSPEEKEEVVHRDNLVIFTEYSHVTETA